MHIIKTLHMINIDRIYVSSKLIYVIAETNLYFFHVALSSKSKKVYDTFNDSK